MPHFVGHEARPGQARGYWWQVPSNVWQYWPA
jgi:hypothetical protein